MNEQITDEQAQRLAEYDALHRIASTATAVLESEAGCKSLAELAQAVNAAGWGDWTEHYPDLEQPCSTCGGVLRQGGLPCKECGKVAVVGQSLYLGGKS